MGLIRDLVYDKQRSGSRFALTLTLVRASPSSRESAVVWRQIMAVSSGRDFDQSAAFYAFLVGLLGKVHPSYRIVDL